MSVLGGKWTFMIKILVREREYRSTTNFPEIPLCRPFTEGSPNLPADRVRTVPYRTVPYRFPRGAVLVDRTAYRTFLTVFRDFCLKARTLPRFKFYRSAV
jgi:hypothetical protein